MDGLNRRFRGLEHRALADGLLVVSASTPLSRLRGLGGLAAMPADHGLALPDSSVHTLTMRFSLDLIWLDGDGRLLRVDRDVPPRRIRVCRAAHSVLEVAAGCADAFLAAGAAGVAD